MQTLTAKPLSEREIRQLEKFLMDRDDLDAPMDISTLDGYLCAVLSGPNVIMPSQWMRWVWDMEHGEQSPAFRNEKQAQRILELLMRHANGIAGMLTYAPGDFEPLFYEHKTEGDTVTIVDEWCGGYVKGMSLDPAGWQPVKDAHPQWFEVIELYGTEEGWERLKTLVEEHPDNLHRHQALVEKITPAVRDIHAYWLARRGPAVDKVHSRQRPVRNAPTPGRNDPCPCGSGKKFKRCHGAPGALH
jgi:uncharacterized protein